MMRYVALLVLLVMVCFVGHQSQAQTPDLAVRYYRTGEKKMREGDWLAAAEAFTKAITTNARLKSGKLQEEKGTSGNLFDPSHSEVSQIRVSDPFTACALTCRAWAELHLSEFDQAIADFEQALRIKPKLLDAYWGRGIVRSTKGDHDGALLDFNRMISIDPKQSSAYLHRGYVMLEKKDFGAALDDFDRALELDPRFAWAQHGRGMSLMKQGKFESAVSAFTAAVELDPGIAESYANRGLALIVLGRETGAQTDLRKAVELKPECKSDLERRTELAKELKERKIARLRQ